MRNQDKANCMDEISTKLSYNEEYESSTLFEGNRFSKIRNRTGSPPDACLGLGGLYNGHLVRLRSFILILMVHVA